METYENLIKIGEGTYGVVFRAHERTTGQTVAVKRIRLEEDEEGVPSTAVREIAILKDLHHPNIVHFKDVVVMNKYIYLVFEYLVQDLKHYMNSVRSIRPSVVKCYLFQLINGVAFCHRRRILHRDLKPQNILLNMMGQLKLADFGLARSFGIPVRNYTNEVVTLWYRAPEILLGSREYSTPVDVWSIGCIFAEMVLKKPIFSGDCEIDQLYKIFRVLGTPNESIWESVSQYPEFRNSFPQWPRCNISELVPTLDVDGLDLLCKMLTYNPRDRITAASALLHPYFNDIDRNSLGISE